MMGGGGWQEGREGAHTVVVLDRELAVRIITLGDDGTLRVEIFQHSVIASGCLGEGEGDAWAWPWDCPGCRAGEGSWLQTRER